MIIQQVMKLAVLICASHSSDAWGDPGPTRVICQRVCDAPEATVILRLPVDGKFAITVGQVESSDVSDTSDFFLQLL